MTPYSLNKPDFQSIPKDSNYLKSNFQVQDDINKSNKSPLQNVSGLEEFH